MRRGAARSAATEGPHAGAFLQHCYGDVSVARDGWSVRATGFYPVERGTAARTSLTIRNEVRP